MRKPRLAPRPARPRPAAPGRARPDLRADIRSTPFKGYVIFFRYLPSEREREILEIVNVLEGHRDLVGYFADRR
jgi:toxin ParE1/3/4